uniref:Reverse transcriptase domain-containing protein n=1 Tax=Ascaris lumbricoides TaxID=6252 RepID=A0A0M3ICT4_ASCLU
MLKLGNELLVAPLKSLFNNMIEYPQIPEYFAFSKTILPKKGNRGDIRNYRPIVCKRLQQQIEQKQDVEQAGFRLGKSTTDEIHLPTMLIRKTRQYNLPLYCCSWTTKKASTLLNMHPCGNLWEASPYTLQ